MAVPTEGAGDGRRSEPPSWGTRRELPGGAHATGPSMAVFDGCQILRGPPNRPGRLASGGGARRIRGVPELALHLRAGAVQGAVAERPLKRTTSGALLLA